MAGPGKLVLSSGQWKRRGDGGTHDETTSQALTQAAAFNRSSAVHLQSPSAWHN